MCMKVCVWDCVCVSGGGVDYVCVRGDADDTQHLKHRIRKM